MPNLLIISHTMHFKTKNGEIVGWESTVREINQFTHIFDSIYHAAPLYKGIPQITTIPYEKGRVDLHPLIPTGGDGILNKLRILFFMPINILRVLRIINKADWIHFRAPTNIGLFLLPLLNFFITKKVWVKYAGNWKQSSVPWSYKTQRWWLKNIFKKSFVTINGKWENQDKHLLSFYNPCLTDDELNDANRIGVKKDFSENLNLCFVGRGGRNKGVVELLMAVKALDSSNKISELNIVGMDKDEILDTNFEQNNIKIHIFGWVNRKKLNRIYEKSHFIVLPTKSEGFPKVIAEASAYGCIPIITNFKPINQIIHDNHNGILLDNPSAKNIQECIQKINSNKYELKNISSLAIEVSKQFTYRKYIKRIELEIINESI